MKPQIYDIIIAIDPDCDKSGMAILDTTDCYLELHSLTFVQVYNYIEQWMVIAYERDNTLAVVIEAGWLNKSNWHLKVGDNKRQAAAKGYAVGRNHEVGRKLFDLCQHLHLEAHLIPPLRKMWRGKDGKITHEELTQFAPINKKRTNQEERDAALIAWNFANLPIRIKPQTYKRIRP